MTLKDSRDKEVRDALDIETRPLFPGIYEGFIEADALAQGEDAILGVLRNAIYRYFQNRNLQTLNEEAAEALESGLGLSHTGTIEERRATLIEVINRRFVLNDAEIAARIEQMANGEDVRFRIDPQALKLEIWKDGGEDGSEFIAYDIAEALKPMIPQNLQLIAEMHSHGLDIDERMTMGTVCAIATSIETETVNNKGVYIIWLESCGTEKTHVIKAIKQLLEIGLTEAKKMADAAPIEITRYYNRLEAESALATMLSTEYNGVTLAETDAILYIYWRFNHAVQRYCHNSRRTSRPRTRRGTKRPCFVGKHRLFINQLGSADTRRITRIDHFSEHQRNRCCYFIHSR